MFDSEFYITLGFLAFFAVLYFFKAHTVLLSALDGTVQKKISDLLQAKTVRAAAEQNAKELIAKADTIKSQIAFIETTTQHEVVKIKDNAAQKIVDYNKKSSELLATKVEIAERQALADIKLHIIDEAYQATEKHFQQASHAVDQDKILAKSLADLKSLAALNTATSA